MTAYGRSEQVVGTKEICVEIKSVNNRFLDCSIKIPRSYSYLEDKIKKELNAKGISRGKIEISVSITDSESAVVSVDSSYAKGYIDALYLLRDEFGLSDDISVMTVARNQEIFKVKRPEVDEEKEWNDLLSVLSPALDGFIAMREQEGYNLANDIRGKISLLRDLTKRVDEMSKDDISSYRSRLEAKLRQVLADNRVTADENRILTECAIFADKVAVDEEIVRLNSHFGAFLDFINAKDAVGRKMDFLLQEMNRETNTIGSKCSNTEIARLVVEMKSELEKIREQIQNIE
jgi:uncharacterized protein (TIGR00255 family)